MAEDLIAILRALEVAEIDPRIKSVVRDAVELELNGAGQQAFLNLLENAIGENENDN